jgi:hypothetical protein
VCDAYSDRAYGVYAVHRLILLIYPSEQQVQKAPQVVAAPLLHWDSRAVMAKKARAGLRALVMMVRQRWLAIVDY